MCLYPKLINNRRYTANKKNGGIIPAIIDIRTKLVPVGCGKCIECSKRKAREWQVRLLEDVRENRNGKFVTMTFSNESIRELVKETKGLKGYEKDNEIATIATRWFLERWRKKYKKSLRHWLITELGHNGTENIHMHGIVWTNESLEEVEKIWKYGWIWKGRKTIGKIQENYVNEKTVNYITKYISKRDEINKEYRPKILTSAGIGGNYIERQEVIRNKYNGKETREYYKTKTGHKMSLPIYWRNKIYSEEEREKLWINMLDRNERYVLGQKINIKENEKDYNKALKHARIKNNRLGYGDDSKNWDRKEYENKRRELRIMERIGKESKENVEQWMIEMKVKYEETQAKRVASLAEEAQAKKEVYNGGMKPSEQW